MLIQTLLSLAKEHDFPLYNLSVYEDGNIQTVQPVEVNDVQPVYSVSKSFAATAAGVLISHGVFSASDSVWDILHPAYPSICGEDWKKVTLGHVLSQTTGIGRSMIDIDCDRTEDYPTDDYLALCLSEPLVTEPGTAFQYSDSNFYLVSRLVAAACGRPMQDVLRDAVFRPLGFQGHAVAVCPHGHAIGGSGMFFRSIDMLRFGLLYHRGGVWNDRRILSEEWCRDAGTVHSPNGDYGYGFWLEQGKNFLIAGGMFQQSIFISTSHPVVVAWTAHDRHGRDAMSGYLRENFG